MDNILFCFIVEGEGAIDIYANCYGRAVEKLEMQVGRNLYGKYYLEKEIRPETHHAYYRFAK